MFLFFFFKQKTAYEMRISDWSSDVCSSDLGMRAVKDFGQFSNLVPRPTLPHSIPRMPSRILALSASSAAISAMISSGSRSGASSALFGFFTEDRKSVVSGKSVSVRVDLGGRRTIKKKKNRH